MNFLKYKEYIASIEFSQTDEVFHGKIHGINDLVSFEGRSVEELKSAFYEAVDDYLDTCQKLGKKPDKTFKGSFNVRITSYLHRNAALIAAQNNMSLNDFVSAAISYAIKHKNVISAEEIEHAPQDEAKVNSPC